MSAEVVLIAGAVLLGAVVFGITGYGFAATVTPILIHLMAPAEVVLMGQSLGLIQIVAILVAVHRFIDARASLCMIGAAVAGMPIGLVVLRSATATQMKLLIGSLTVGAALLVLLGFSVRVRRQAVGLAVAGFLGGLLSTSTGLTGIPPGLFLLNERWGKHEVRANLATFLLGASILTLVALLTSRTVSVAQLLSTLLFAPVAVVGIVVGNFLANRMSVTLFRRLAILVAGVAGLSSMIAGLAALR